MYQGALESIPRINTKQQHKDGLPIKAWDEEHQSVKDNIEEVSNIIHGLWNSSSDVLSECELELMDPL